MSNQEYKDYIWQKVGNFMLILTSRGLDSQNLIKETKKYIQSNMKKAAIITTASVGYKENDWHIPRIKSELQSLGLSVECFDIEFQKPEELDMYDVILINGGNPFYLLYHMRRTNCKTVFQKLLDENKIIIGVSAGSIVLGTTCELIFKFDPQMNDIVRLNEFTGLGLTSINLCPHTSRFVERYDNFLKIIDDFQKLKGITITKINDGEAVFVVGEKLYKIYA